MATRPEETEILTGALVSASVLAPTERSRTVLALVLPLRGVRGLCAGYSQGRWCGDGRRRSEVNGWTRHDAELAFRFLVLKQNLRKEEM